MTFGEGKGALELSVYIQYPAIEMAKSNEAEMIQAQETVREASLVCDLILGTYKARFRKLVEDIGNDYT